MRTRIIATCVAVLATLALTAAAPSDRGGWYELTFDGDVSQLGVDAAVSAGAQGLAPIGRHTYLGWFPEQPQVPGAVAAERAPAEKVDAGLDPEARHLVVLTHPTADLARIALAGEIADVRISAARPGLQEVYVQALPGRAAEIARDPDVAYVGPASTGFASENEASALITAGLTGAAPGYEDHLADLGLSGAGVNVTIVDSGIDPRHPDLAPALVGKVERSKLATGVPADDGGHGSHVAGIVAGRGLGFAAPGLERPRDAGGYLYGLGVAPGAGLIDQNVLANTASGPLCGLGWPPAEWEPLTADALALDSHIWNASWQSCEGTGAGYTFSASEMDRLTRDGDSSSDGPQPFTMVFSAGNSGQGSNPTDTRLTAPKEAKNTIVVASLDVAAPNNISSFSSRGPARDGRIVPTVAAPGGGVLSTRSTTATASCSTPVLPTAHPLGSLYAACSGTSMAAPHVTGAVALITEWWRGAHEGADPSPAMAKSLLVNTAVDMGKRDIPNRHEGWGRVDLDNLFRSEALRGYVDEDVLLSDVGESHVVEFDVYEDVEEPLRVTLGWTDAPSFPGAPRALVNDLDLIVTAPDGTVFRGNVFDRGMSQSGGEADALNNTENVFLDATMAGTWRVEVVAAALPGDGDPFRGDGTDQDFALVVSYPSTVPPPVLLPDDGADDPAEEPESLPTGLRVR